DIPAQTDLGGIAADFATIAHQDVFLAGEVGRSLARQIPPVGVARHHSQRLLLAATSNENLRQWVRPRVAVCLGYVEVAALPGGGRLGPHHLDELHGFLQLVDAYSRRRKRVTVGQVLFLLPAGAYAECKSTAH